MVGCSHYHHTVAEDHQGMVDTEIVGHLHQERMVMGEAMTTGEVVVAMAEAMGEEGQDMGGHEEAAEGLPETGVEENDHLGADMTALEEVVAEVTEAVTDQVGPISDGIGQRLWSARENHLTSNSPGVSTGCMDQPVC